MPNPTFPSGIASGEGAALQDFIPSVAENGIASGGNARYDDNVPKPSDETGISKGEGASLEDTVPKPVVA
jgi:hypothetical protein